MSVSLKIIKTPSLDCHSLTEVVLPEPGGMIGSDSSCALVLLCDAQVSGKHAFIKISENNCEMTVLGKSGVYLNDGSCLIPEQVSVRLQDGDLLKIGGYILSVCIISVMQSATDEISTCRDNSQFFLAHKTSQIHNKNFGFKENVGRETLEKKEDLKVEQSKLSRVPLADPFLTYKSTFVSGAQKELPTSKIDKEAESIERNDYLRHAKEASNEASKTTLEEAFSVENLVSTEKKGPVLNDNVRDKDQSSALVNCPSADEFTLCVRSLELAFKAFLSEVDPNQDANCSINSLFSGSRKFKEYKHKFTERKNSGYWELVFTSYFEQAYIFLSEHREILASSSNGNTDWKKSCGNEEGDEPPLKRLLRFRKALAEALYRHECC